MAKAGYCCGSSHIELAGRGISNSGAFEMRSSLAIVKLFKVIFKAIFALFS